MDGAEITLSLDTLDVTVEQIKDAALKHSDRLPLLKQAEILDFDVIIFGYELDI